MKDQVDGEMEEMEKSLPVYLQAGSPRQHLDTQVLVAPKGRKCHLFLSLQLEEVKTNKGCHNSHSHLSNQWEAKMNSRILNNKICHPILTSHSHLSLKLEKRKESNKTCHNFLNSHSLQWEA